MFDEITKPEHYQFSKECREVRDVINDRIALLINAGYPPELCYNYANAIKYLLRWPGKGGLKDVKKARECVKELLLQMVDSIVAKELQMVDSTVVEKLQKASSIPFTPVTTTKDV